MARYLSDLDNELCIDDNISGTTVRLFHRMPTPGERIRYTNECYPKDNKGRTRIALSESRQKFGMKILTGIGNGDFLDGDGKPMSSDKSDENYNQAWRDLVAKYAIDLVELMAAQVFDASASIAAVEPEQGVVDNPDPT